MDLTTIAAWRLHNLRLVGELEASPERAVHRVGAVQAQRFDGGKWSIAQRTAGTTDASIDHLYDEGRILRTHALRPTWHFLHRDDIRLALQVTAPRIHAKLRTRRRQLELDDALLQRCTEIIGRALQGGIHLTRKQIGATLQEAEFEVGGQRLPHILMHAELHEVICSGPMNGTKHTYALLDERAPVGPRPDADQALAEFTLRYFTSHGPATMKDLRAWSGLKLADIERGIAMNRAHLDSLELDGLTYWHPGDPPHAGPTQPAAHLLNRYDELMMGYLETRHAVNTAGLLETLHPDELGADGPLVIDGQVAGLWRSTSASTSAQGPRAPTIELRPKRRLNEDETAAVQREVERYGDFLGTGARMEFHEA